MRQHVKDRIDDVVGMIYEDGIVTSFPTTALIPLKYIPNCELTSYRRLAERNGTSVREISRYLGSSDGRTEYQRSRDRYLIMINTDRMPARVQWTIAHEAGHIFAGHMQEDWESRFSRQREIEEEADYFAASFLAPLWAICLLRVRSVSELQEKFGLSRTAASRRWREYQESGFGMRKRNSIDRPQRSNRPPDIWPDENDPWCN